MRKKALLMRDTAAGRVLLLANLVRASGHGNFSVNKEAIAALKAEGWHWDGDRVAWYNSLGSTPPPCVGPVKDGGEIA